MYLGSRYHTIPILICKRDFKGAFILIPVSINGIAYMGCRFSIYMVLYLALFFGWRPSTAGWGAISTLPMQYVAAYRSFSDNINGPEWCLASDYV